jgi:hypothetical protein
MMKKSNPLFDILDMIDKHFKETMTEYDVRYINGMTLELRRHYGKDPEFDIIECVGAVDFLIGNKDDILEVLQLKGFDQRIIDAAIALSPKEGEHKQNHFARIAKNPIATKVRLTAVKYIISMTLLDKSNDEIFSKTGHLKDKLSDFEMLMLLTESETYEENPISTEVH